MEGVFSLIFALFALSIYFVPTIIAFFNNSKNALGVFVINLMFGWTVLFWVVAFIWACASGREKPESGSGFADNEGRQKDYREPLPPESGSGFASNKGEGWIGLKNRQKAK